MQVGSESSQSTQELHHSEATGASSSSTISPNSVLWKKRAAVKYNVMREMQTPMIVEAMARWYAVTAALMRAAEFASNIQAKNWPRKPKNSKMKICKSQGRESQGSKGRQTHRVSVSTP